MAVVSRRESMDVEGRERLPGEREGLTVKLEVGSPPTELYIIANRYPDGRLGEVFIKGAGKEGSTLQGMIDQFALLFSISVQSGADFGLLARKLHRQRFEPAGKVNHPLVREADSLVDAVVKWLAVHFGDDALRAELGVGE